jgi:hypothetical protein
MPTFQVTAPYGVFDPTRGSFAVGDVVESAENPNPHFWVEVTQTKPKKDAPVEPDKEQ